METLYPIYYGTRLVTWDVLVASFEEHMHPEAARRGFNFIACQEGRFGIGGGYRAPGSQPNKPGFASPGKSFHEGQQFPSGLYYTAWDLVVARPGFAHRAPYWSEVPAQGSQLSIEYGYHMNIGFPGQDGAEPWHGQPIELDGWQGWVNAGKPDLQYDYPLRLVGPVPEPLPPIKEIMVQFASRELYEGCLGSDVKFYQTQMNNIAGQGLLLDGEYGPKTTQAVKNWQAWFKQTSDGKALAVDGRLGALTQQSIIEISLAVT